MPTDTVLIIQHVEVETPGLILDVLHDHRIPTITRNLIADPEAELPAPAELAGLVIMGGPMNADQLDAYPGLRRERELLTGALRSELPTLGVCLGAQLLARAAGLEVKPGDLGYADELGWAPLRQVDRADPLVGSLADAPAVLHWHGDRIVATAALPALAATDSTPVQAFRAGPVAWGLQFHPEVDPPLLDRWLAEPDFAAEAHRVLGPDALDMLRTQARAVFPTLQPLFERSMNYFCSLIRARVSH
ncbi:type 1 glutamine amidotransferase [Nocardia yunnanensis]|uniref:Type 1 glutamine amidotransferase n=1 Tax=Nocardia yunnanensis TaxID=2382165 RepID=A0A386ZFK0_9NOCA|nr:type 1 glutamine amidotransferase [Nocardia yunnanensis]AYF76270.1 type 1 glutamine amidotransferase [Nocardia yunnanensis]